MNKEKRSDYSNLEGEFLGLGPNFMLGRIFYVTTELPLVPRALCLCFLDSLKARQEPQS